MPDALTRTAADADGWYVPDLCGLRALFTALLAAQLLALVISLAGAGQHPLTEVDWGGRLGFISLLVQLSALSGAAVLCLGRSVFARLSPLVATVVAAGLVLGVIALVNEAAFRMSGATAGHAEFMLRNLLIAAVALGVTLHYFYVQHRWQRQIAAEHAARLQALKARIRPHFLFNCLNTIAGLTRSDPAAAERAVEDLADVFRASLTDIGTSHSLAEEFDLCRRYLAIEATRLGDRLRVHWDTAALPPDTRVPKLLLQPLVENAVYHGVETLADGGEIQIAGHVDADWLCVAIRNPMSDEAARRSGAGNKMAQDNVRARLLGELGADASFSAEAGDDCYEVRLRWRLEALEA